jgi:hypothetical protein
MVQQGRHFKQARPRLVRLVSLKRKRDSWVTLVF